MNPAIYSPKTSESTWTHAPGPANRESFFEAQKRNRRRAWRLEAASALSVAVVAVPLSLVLTPLIYALFFALTDFMSVFIPLPDFLQAFFKIMDPIFNADSLLLLPVGLLILGAALVVIPGTALLLTSWLGLRAVFMRSGVGGILLTLGARPPRENDLEEKQLVDVVEEMALACGLRTPRLMMLDSSVVNAAAVGSSQDDATLVVSRRLLDEFNRDETMGVIAYLVGMISNGDLQVAFTISSVWLVLGLITTLLETPFGPRSRQAMAAMSRFIYHWLSHQDNASEAEAVEELLTRSMSMDDKDDISTYSKSGKTRLRDVVMLPLLGTGMGVMMVRWVCMTLFVGPLISWLWRTRCYLADATAVQLTRDPEGLAHALVRLADSGAVIPGGQWASHLFIAGPEAGKGRGRADLQREVQELRAQGKDPADPAVRAEIYQELLQKGMLSQQNQTQAEEKDDEQDSAMGAQLIPFHPSLASRLKRLRAFGSDVEIEGTRPFKMTLPILLVTIFILGPLGLLMAGLLLFAAGLAVMVTLAIDMLFLGFALVPIHFLTRVVLK
jgi:Zn-dependent protease with chaperone function